VKYQVTRRPSDISVQFVTTNGATILAPGYGTHRMARSDMLQMIPAVLNAGFCHFDTAQIHRNEAEVGHS
jgi:2,5-diketo-D-gluconate reductase B